MFGEVITVPSGWPSICGTVGVAAAVDQRGRRPVRTRNVRSTGGRAHREALVPGAAARLLAPRRHCRQRRTSELDNVRPCCARGSARGLPRARLAAPSTAIRRRDACRRPSDVATTPPITPGGYATAMAPIPCRRAATVVAEGFRVTGSCCGTWRPCGLPRAAGSGSGTWTFWVWLDCPFGVVTSRCDAVRSRWVAHGCGCQPVLWLRAHSCAVIAKLEGNGVIGEPLSKERAALKPIVVLPAWLGSSLIAVGTPPTLTWRVTGADVPHGGDWWLWARGIASRAPLGVRSALWICRAPQVDFLRRRCTAQAADRRAAVARTRGVEGGGQVRRRGERQLADGGGEQAGRRRPEE